MERASQALQTRKRAPASHPLHGDSPLHPPARLSIWSVLSSVSRSRHEKAGCHDGRQAQDAHCGLSAVEIRARFSVSDRGPLSGLNELAADAERVL